MGERTATRHAAAPRVVVIDRRQSAGSGGANLRGLDDGPAAASKLAGKLLGRHVAHQLLLRGQPRRGHGVKSAPFSRCVLELVDKRCCLVSSKHAGGLTLGETHGATGVSEAGVACVLDERKQALYLPR